MDIPKSGAWFMDSSTIFYAQPQINPEYGNQNEGHYHFEVYIASQYHLCPIILAQQKLS